MKNPNIKYYKIPSKSQSPNPNAYRSNFKIPKIPTPEKIGSIEIWNEPLQGLRVNPFRVFGDTGGARDGAEPHMFGSIGMYWDLGFPKSCANTGGGW
ncbi:MAG: hypothetical protein IBX41_04350 [Methanophagales archaeon]|nr:hypothetical protein [Methanophagales archaeon]